LVDIPQFKVETGIGYPQSYERFRVFESYAWYHYIMGKNDTSGNDYHWVIPNYYDTSEWQLNEHPSNHLVYFGRLGDIKGLQIVVEISKARPDLKVIICGQGDPTPYMKSPNIEYHPPIHGLERSAFLGNAMAVLMPTRYVEPFGGVTVEAQMTGTPVLGSTYGSFTETIQQGFNGYRCATLGDFLQGIKNIEDGKLDRKAISEYNTKRYNMFSLAHDYDKVFTQIHDLYDAGWYSPRPIWVD
jgi:glycosyltransferase involved in cell wall biosynthesis